MGQPLNDQQIDDLFRQAPGGPATLTGPTGEEPTVQPGRRQLMAQGPPEPNPAAVAGQVIGGGVGAALAPETIVGGGAAMAARAGSGALARSGSPALMKIGNMLLSRFSAVSQLATRAAGAGIGTEVAGEFTHPPEMTPEEASNRRLTDFAMGAGGELIGAGAGVAGRAARKKLGQLIPALGPRATFERLEPGAIDAQARLREFGGNLMAGQMTRGFGVDALQNIAQASFTGGGVIEDQTLRNLTAAEAAVADAVPKFKRSITPKDTGKVIQWLINKPLEAQKIFVRAAYENLDRELAASGNVRMVDLRPIKQEFDRRFATDLEAGEPTAVKISRYLGLAGDDLTTFGKTEDIRRLLGDVYRSRGQDVAPGTAAYTAKILHQLDEARDNAAAVATAFGPRITAAVDAARSARTTQGKFFDEQLIGPLLENVKPEEVGMQLWAANNPTQVNALHDIVYAQQFRPMIKDPDAYWQTIQSGYFSQLRRDAGQTHYGSFDGQKAGSLIDNSNGTFEALFPSKTDQQTIRASVRAMELIQAKPGGTKSGSVLVQMAQGRDVGSLIGQSTNWVINLGAGYYAKGATLGDYAKGLSIAFAPRYLAKVLKSRPFSDWIQRRALVGASGTAASSAFGQLVSALMKSQIPFVASDQSGAQTVFDPSSGISGPAAPTKPQSKYKAP